MTLPSSPKGDSADANVSHLSLHPSRPSLQPLAHSQSIPLRRLDSHAVRAGISDGAQSTTPSTSVPTLPAATEATAAATAAAASSLSATTGSPRTIDAYIPSAAIPSPSSLSSSSQLSFHPPPPLPPAFSSPPVLSPAGVAAAAAATSARRRSLRHLFHGLPSLETGVEETVDNSNSNGPLKSNSNTAAGEPVTPKEHVNPDGHSGDEELMTKKTPPFLRSSPSFNSTSYGAISEGEPSLAATPTAATAAESTQPEEAESTLRRTSTNATAATTTASGVSSRHGTLRRKRSQAATLFAQYEAATGGSMRALPPELEIEAVLGGLGGSRFDAAGTAAPLSAVPSEASFDSDGKADDIDRFSDGYADLDDDLVSEAGYPMLRDTNGHVMDGDEGSDGNSTHSRDRANEPSNPPDNSPFAQVRASVSPVDNILLSINTPRMWLLSTLFSILGSSTNLFFSLRYPSVAITPVIALLLVHPLGLAWDFFLKRDDDPPEEFVDGVLVSNTALRVCHRLGSLGRIRQWLAQGRWNEKEHACVYVSSNVSFGFAFATDVIVEQTKFYKQDVSIIYQLLLIISTQILGYTFAGLSRRFLVRPSGMIWPSTLMSAAMFATLHKEENKPANGWRMSRWNFFYIVFLGAFGFYFIPGLLMPALSYFNVITWFAPDNVVVANLFGVTSGLGLFPMTFDWAQVAYIGSPLLTPFWAAMNVVGGLVVVMWIIAPIAYYSNWLYSSYMPILSAAVFDNKGEVYDVARILTRDFMFDQEAYRNYSRVFLPITYVLSYGVQFAGLASLLTHTACWHGRDIWRQWRLSLEEAAEQKRFGDQRPSSQMAPSTSYEPIPSVQNGGVVDADFNADTNSVTDSDANSPAAANMSHNSVPLQSSTRFSEQNLEGLMSREDVHNRLMKRYRDAPMWWYLLTFVSMTAVGIFIVEYYPIHLPWYGLLMALGICAILFIPIGIVMAVTNQHVSIYLICQLVCGFVFPGRPVANMVFVTYGYISSAQGIKFCADLKLGHYMKVPPRILFKVQMVATLVSSVTQIAVLNWMFGNVPGLCTPEAINGFVCPIARVHFNGSILWGVVGPGEFFGPDAIYRPLVWCFLVGVVAPIPLWLYGRHKKDSILRKVNLPILLGSLGWIPPATGLNFSVWALVCYLFNYLVKRRATAWWAKYTMTLSAALDAALASGIVVVFFTFIYPGLMDNFHWWGTEVYRQGCDWKACAYRAVPEGGKFGPDTW